MYKSRLLICLFFTTLIFVNMSYSAFSNSGIENKWNNLLKREPFIYTIPSVKKTTPVDGVYVKNALRQGEKVPCMRCPDWLANPGIWRIYFNRGTYRIINTATGWKSIGTYIVSKNRILLANDPSCINEFGLYTFKFEYCNHPYKKKYLTFKVIDDPCAIKLRGLNLGEKEWISCHPPNEEAAITEHWPKPDGCR